MRYDLIDPDPRFNNPGVYKIDFVSLSKSERPLNCIVSEGVVGSALIDSASMQTERLEFIAPRHIDVSAKHSSERVATDTTDGTWAVSVHYASVLLGDKRFWMPKTITSTSTSTGSNPVIWSYTAEYSNYHKLEVTSHILPFSGETLAHPGRP